jgi:hypothetical protein
MKYAKLAPAYLLALVFIVFGVMYLIGKAPQQDPATLNDATKSFFGAFGNTGYMTFIKVLEVLGGLLLILPRTRAAGLCIIVPIAVNILAFELFIAKKVGIGIALIALSALAIYFERDRFAGVLSGLLGKTS